MPVGYKTQTERCISYVFGINVVVFDIMFYLQCVLRPCVIKS